MKPHLSDHFTFRKIFRITIFPAVMMVFTSLYSIVDGVFIANFANESSFAAVNLIFPVIFIIGSIGFIFGTGGSALVAKLLGEGKKEKANETFSLIVYTTIIVGLIFSVAFVFLVEPICHAMANRSANTTEQMVNESIKYGRLLASAQVMFMLQHVFQAFFMVNEKSRLGFIFVFAGGSTNILLDALFIGLFRWGVIGAAFATISGYFVAGIGPLIYFFVNKNALIYLGKCHVVLKDIGQTIYNGMSEFVSSISMSIVSVVFNIILLRTYGEVGVSAYGIIMYVSFVFLAIFIGYSTGIAPVVSYNYGAKNTDELNNILRKSMTIIIGLGLLMFTLSLLSAEPFSRIFASGDAQLLELATTAMRIYSFVFLVCGFSIFISCFFTALNNGSISATISFLRTIVFEIGSVLILPLIIGDKGIWYSILVGEIFSTISAFIFLFIKSKKYGYKLFKFSK